MGAENAARAGEPRVWRLVGEKPGDNAQLRVIAAALPWRVEERRLCVRSGFAVRKPRVRASLHHLDLARSDRLEPPWPELVLAVGRRLSMAALWIRERSRGHTRVVLLGKPKGRAGDFDLVVAPALYRLRRRPNVLPLGLPLSRVEPDTLAVASERWRERLAALGRPLTALLVGGPVRPLRLGEDDARRLLAETRRACGADDTALYLTTSRRTPAAVVDALAGDLHPHERLYRWREDDPDNPYLGLLGLADRFVVTSDSVSMMTEVARLGKPLALFEPPAGGWRRRLGSRDLEALPRLLVEQGHAVRLGEPFRPPGAPPPDDLGRVVERVRALLGEHRAG